MIGGGRLFFFFAVAGRISMSLESDVFFRWVGLLAQQKRIYMLGSGIFGVVFRIVFLYICPRRQLQ